MEQTYYDNRELSWLKFNERVLEETEDPAVPLCERLTFASIFQSNLDEFFMIRVGSIYDQMLLDTAGRENKTNMTCEEQLDAIFHRVAELSPRRDAAYQAILQELAVYGVKQVDFRAVTPEEEAHLTAYFNREIKPLISPQLLNKRNPFPFFKNKDIYAVASLEKTKGGSKSGKASGVCVGIIPSNDVFGRLIFLPASPSAATNGGTETLRFMLVEDLLLHCMPQIFEGYKILTKSLMRVTRNADINAEEALYDHDVDFRDAMEELLKKRKKLSPVRMELSRKLDDNALGFLCRHLELAPSQIFYLSTPLDLSFVFALQNKFSAIRYPELFFPKAPPQKSPDFREDMPLIPQIQQKDKLLSYPYESIRPFLRMLMEAVLDPTVVSVKITLYRVARDSKVVEALVSLAERGKDVLVLVELRARFDEENNIGWSKRLEDAGCTVIYGLEDLKVHSKLLLITRKNGDHVDYITQIGTGNYNEKTAALYTDLCLMTANQEIGADANAIFTALAMGDCVEETQTRHLLAAPLYLQKRLIEMIDGEIQEARNGNPAYIGCKLNSITDKILIDKLAEASQAGVKIELLVRGICCLRAGVSGYTENITVQSIVGRLLEHSRIYMFGTPNRQKMYISSADFMTRNTLRRVEVASPVLDEDLKKRVQDMFKIMLRDNVKARVQAPDGTYHKKALGNDAALNSQEYFLRQAMERAEKIPPASPRRKAAGSFQAGENRQTFLYHWFRKGKSDK